MPFEMEKRIKIFRIIKSPSALTQNISKIHTTPMGTQRIKSNLGLQTDDIVLWCMEAIKQADIIIGQGRNWYVYCSGA